MPHIDAPKQEAGGDLTSSEQASSLDNPLHIGQYALWGASIEWSFADGS